jgi:plastocyanin
MLKALCTGLWIVLWGILGPAVAWAQAAEVVVRDYHFHPHELRVKVGTTVKWVNQEKRVSHSVIFLGKDGFESERFFPGESWQRTFDQPGRYEYSCGPHPEMKGVIEVE